MTMQFSSTNLWSRRHQLFQVLLLLVLSLPCCITAQGTPPPTPFPTPAPPTPLQPPATDPVAFFRGRRYVTYYNVLVDQFDAAFDAQSRRECLVDGHLVDITSASENAVVWNLLQQTFRGRDAWIGLVPDLNTGNYSWPNLDINATYFNWDEGEPNLLLDISSFCVVMSAATGKWKMASCFDGGFYASMAEFDCPKANRVTTLEGHYYERIDIAPNETFYDLFDGVTQREPLCPAAVDSTPHLVHIQNAAENNFVKNFMGAVSSWIGLDDNNRGRFTWSGKSFPPVNYSNWLGDDGAPLPGSATESSCTAIVMTPSGSWAPRSCSSFFVPFYIVEHNCPEVYDYVRAYVKECMDRVFVVGKAQCVDPIGLGAALDGKCLFKFDPTSDRRRYNRHLSAAIRNECLIQLQNRRRTLVPTQEPSVKPSSSPSSSQIPSQSPSESPRPTASALPSSSPSSSPKPSVSNAPTAPVTLAPTLRFRYNVKSCLADVFTKSACGCGAGGLTCFRRVNRLTCLVKYQQKNQINDRDELQTFAEKTRLAYIRECAFQNGGRRV